MQGHLRDPAIKQYYVTTMFDLVAPRYDRFTRWFSYGLDARWKRQLLAEAATRLSPGAVALDAACGTGDLMLGLRKQGVTVIGLDPSAAMLASCRMRCRDADLTTDLPPSPPTAAPRLLRGDLMALPLPAAAVGMVTVGYGLRNVPELGAALAEIRRVLRPGGWLLSLDFFRPDSPLWAATFVRYLRVAGRLYGWWWHGEPNAYGYIAESVRRFLTARAFQTALGAAGFDVAAAHRKLAGGIGIHVARRR